MIPIETWWIVASVLISVLIFMYFRGLYLNTKDLQILSEQKVDLTEEGLLPSYPHAVFVSPFVNVGWFLWDILTSPVPLHRKWKQLVCTLYRGHRLYPETEEDREMDRLDGIYACRDNLPDETRGRRSKSYRCQDCHFNMLVLEFTPEECDPYRKGKLPPGGDA